MEQPLAGVTALDFGQIYNGPYCGFLLAQAGARVIKVESPLGEPSLRGIALVSGVAPWSEGVPPSDGAKRRSFTR